MQFSCFENEKSMLTIDFSLGRLKFLRITSVRAYDGTTNIRPCKCTSFNQSQDSRPIKCDATGWKKYKWAKILSYRHTEGIEMVPFYINDANSGMMQSANNEICSYDYCVLLCTQFYIQLVYRPHFGTWILLFGPFRLC